MTIRHILLVLFVLVPSIAHADWKAVETVQTYAIRGASGIELYRSIGENGPKAGPGRAIAFTDFKLTWRRNYVPQNGGCTLISAVPNLTLIYRLPKPSGTLPPAVRQSWETFIEGVRRHEKTHGEMIVDMVRQIEAVSVGFSVPDDPKCSKIREQLTQKLGQLSLAQRQKSRDFDRAELSDGGVVHQLILNLANGP
ncbi:DUF922 domain-containing protein [Corticibacterium sp. UT-5YL-CI-8]|nr:DUF922 domain-containing protein [Tianweitania sp. UT-5YL-CI-8]